MPKDTTLAWPEQRKQALGNLADHGFNLALYCAELKNQIQSWTKNPRQAESSILRAEDDLIAAARELINLLDAGE